MSNYKVQVINETVSLFIPINVQKQINLLHEKVGAKEWCGVLLYSVLEGKIENPETLKLQVEGVYPLSIDSETYTEHEFDEGILNMFELYPQADLAVVNKKKAWRQGLIHTHHRMATFFSGTDTQELRNNAPSYDWYLSLIVNFDGKYTAKICFTEEIEISYKYKSYIDKFLDKRGSNKEMIYFEITCDIVKEIDTMEDLAFAKVVLDLVESTKPAAVSSGMFRQHYTEREDSVVRVPGFQQKGGQTYQTKKQEEKMVKKYLNMHTVRMFMVELCSLENLEKKGSVNTYTASNLLLAIIKEADLWASREFYKSTVVDYFEDTAVKFFGDWVDNKPKMLEIVNEILDLFDNKSTDHIVGKKYVQSIFEEVKDYIDPVDPEGNTETEEDFKQNYLGWEVD